MRNYIELFVTGLMQVVLVCLNTYQIAVYSKSNSTLLLLGIVVVGFLISLIWTFNVKKVAFGGFKDRICYASGAATGSLVGVIVGSIIY